MRHWTRLSNTAPRVLAALGFLGGLALAACSGDFHSNRGLEDMVCDATGCFHCDQGDCVEYRCDETHQCPMQRTCSVDNRCLTGDGSSTSAGGGCDSHDDCPIGQICTLEGACVTSPGGGPSPDAVSDTSPDAVTSPDAGPNTSDTEPGPTDVASDIADTTVADAGPTDTTDASVPLPDHPDDACLVNGDCGLDGTCINGGCYFPCAEDGTCAPGQACDAGACRPLTTPENQCTFNGECGASRVCLEGACLSTCQETLDCPAHTRCAGGLCVADTSPVLQCSGPASCADGKGCVDGKCLTPCSTGTCNAGLECRFGYCHKTPTCFDANDCGGRDCVDGTCLPE
jgi:hypothetical protein